MTAPLTELKIRKAIVEARKPGAKRITLRDPLERGLKLVCGARGGVWSFASTVRQGEDRREVYVTIGPIEAYSLAMAREEAVKLKADFRAGVDPIAQRRLEAARATTLGNEAAKWNPTGRAKHAASDRNNLRLALSEMALAEAPPEALTRRDLHRLIDMHRDRPATARARIGALRRFLDHLVGQEILEANQVRLLTPKAMPKPPPSRSRYPTAAEVQRLWNATGAMTDAFRDILRLLILCPLRRNELATLTADEVDLNRREIRLKPLRTKNGRAFELPLSDAAVAILAPRVQAAAPGARLFKAFDWDFALKRLRPAAGVTFSPHDLRRLFASESGEHRLGDFDLIDGLLAHSGSASRSGVSGVYQRSSRAAERRAIMAAWAELVAHAVKFGTWPRERVQTSNVVALRNP